ncbi:MAG: DinB family protein [Acidobacteriota bacterium]
MKTIDMLQTTRRLVVGLSQGLPPEELVRIPTGFNNNVLWHLGHLAVTQQLLCYQMAGVPMVIDDAWVGLFRKGTSPRDWAADASIPDYDEIVAQLHGLATRLREDYDAGLFTGYKPYGTSAGVQLDSIEDAIVFNSFHEGIHVGYLMALRRALSASA